ncbi:MAG: DUF3775 domain-containing protein [Alphaproteobacteria bacterium]|nr:DUF3775 domain-containing protein [Alphaproteobacteria bacterium]
MARPGNDTLDDDMLDEDGGVLGISPEKVCYIIVKAREFDVKVAPGGLDTGDNPSDNDDLEILEDYADDPTFQELVSALENLNEDELIEVLGLMWLGREDYTAEDWPEVLEEAGDAHDDKLVAYLIGTPLLGDYLEEGLSQLGYSCEDYEIDRL